MSLSRTQGVFALNVAQLIVFAHAQGYYVTLGEAYRTEYQQREYLRQEKTKVSRSQHQKRLAIDLNLFINGQYQTQAEPYKELAEFWKSLHPKNRAGYDWGWDANHFEMIEA